LFNLSASRNFDRLRVSWDKTSSPIEHELAAVGASTITIAKGRAFRRFMPTKFGSTHCKYRANKNASYNFASPLKIFPVPRMESVAMPTCDRLVFA
jgi:hypothetical protein